MGLLEALKQYASDAAGGSLNPEVGNTLSGLLNYGKDRAKYIGGLLDDSSPINKDFKNWHDRTQLGLADLIAGKEGPQADYGYSQIMNMAGVAPVGMTAWHGSPHKFDKFSLDKIGTGEGAQAYGHGLYLAESPEVAKTYQNVKATPTFEYNGKRGDFSPYKKGEISADEFMAWLGDRLPNLDPARRIEVAKSNLNLLGGDVRGRLTTGELAPITSPSFISEVESLAKNAKADDWKPMQSPTLYKTDIPDEAVARFLDWDKPLSQQAPEVQAVLQNIRLPMIDGQVLGKTGYTTAVPLDKALGQNAYDALAWRERAQGASDQLKAAGIPGIRYLDGGSRSAGQGSSNYVLFDPEMIRILERNGQPTGLEPWKPGEYRLGDLLK